VWDESFLSWWAQSSVFFHDFDDDTVMGCRLDAARILVSTDRMVLINEEMRI